MARTPRVDRSYPALFPCGRDPSRPHGPEEREHEWSQLTAAAQMSDACVSLFMVADPSC